MRSRGVGPALTRELRAASGGGAGTPVSRRTKGAVALSSSGAESSPQTNAAARRRGGGRAGPAREPRTRRGMQAGGLRAVCGVCCGSTDSCRRLGRG